ncbi:MAG: protein tyrosine phosphatase [Candidatus Pacebacteria bacterium]|nr:protein tyrosine phosphatase [Candidatus Paceibacterota bacterium]
MHVLFVCSKNQWRSPTAERIFSHHPKLLVRSAGTRASAKHQVSLKDIEWADIIFCMENTQKDMIKQRFSNIKLSPLHVLDIEDHYHFMDPELVHLLQISLEKFLPSL